MKITSFGHSCLLAESDDRVAIIDPGVFSWKSGSFDIDAVPKIDRILITHPHPDHCFPEFIKVIIDKFPEIQVVGSQAVEKTLKSAGIDIEVRSSTQCSSAFESPHESVAPIFGKEATPPQDGFHFRDRLTHPGDSHSFSETKEILAMPFVAPWGSAMDAMIAIESLEAKPKHIIPIHDWFFSDEAKDWLYGPVAKKLESMGIELHPLKPGQSVEL